MKVSVYIDEKEVEAKLTESMTNRVNAVVKDSVESWGIKQIIEDEVKKMLSSRLPSMIENALSVNGKTIEDRVDRSIDILIKQKTRRALKG